MVNEERIGWLKLWQGIFYSLIFICIILVIYGLIRINIFLDFSLKNIILFIAVPFFAGSWSSCLIGMIDRKIHFIIEDRFSFLDASNYENYLDKIILDNFCKFVKQIKISIVAMDFLIISGSILLVLMAYLIVSGINASINIFSEIEIYVITTICFMADLVKIRLVNQLESRKNLLKKKEGEINEIN